MSQLREFHFKVPTIICVGCKATIEAILKNSDKLSMAEVDVNYVNKKIYLKVDPHSRETGVLLDDEQLIKLIRSELKSVGHDVRPPNYLIKGIIGMVAGIGLVALSLSGLALPLGIMTAISFAATALTVYLGKESYRASFSAFIKARRLTMDSLFTISTLTAVGVSLASLFVPWLPMMLDAALLIFGFRHVGKAIEEAAKSKVISELDFVDRAPREVNLVENGSLKQVPIGSVRAGQTIRIYKGELIPLDGVYQDADQRKLPTVYDTIISGSVLPSPIHSKDILLAGMRLGEEVASIDLKLNGNSYLATLDGNLENARRQKASLESAADRWLQYFVPIVFSFAILAGVAVSFLATPILAIQSSIWILVGACPCVLGLITPLMVKLGITKSSENGARIQDGKSLEEMASVDTFAFDMHGTLTQGKPQVVACTLQNDKDRALLEIIYAMEKQATHPVAQAVCEYLKDVKRINADNLDVAVDLKNHSGLSAQLYGDNYLLGNINMMKESGVSDLPNQADTEKHLIYIAKNGAIIGCFEIQDPVRQDAKKVIQHLQERKMQIHIITGADLATALNCAKQLGIAKTHVVANCKDKSVEINRLQKQGRIVAMVGDAGNDAVAISASNVGIAIASPASDNVTLQNAGIIIYQSSLLPILTAYQVACDTVNKIKQSLAISLSYNVAAMILPSVLAVGIGFVLNPAAGVALMVAQTCSFLASAWHFRNKPVAALEAEIPQTTNKLFLACGKAAASDQSSPSPAKRVTATNLAQKTPNLTKDHSSGVEVNRLPSLRVC